MASEINLNILLYQPLIPQNTGNIGRLCVGTNCRLHLVRPLGFELSEKQVRRAGLDYWPHLDLVVHDSWSPESCPGRFFLFSKKAQRSAFDVEYRSGDWLVFGSETTGLPKDMLANHETHALALPQYGPVRSQNLSNAVSAACYLALRDLQRQGVVRSKTASEEKSFLPIANGQEE
ncbi:MAG: tRNA (cytidine(34)-2'-O)-methyltransferase [Planctomycetes bacterium]|nr:tRNA (cytidine(34)-2'-O)-methyltransferase [Planctomycetota bacterium]